MKILYTYLQDYYKNICMDKTVSLNKIYILYTEEKYSEARVLNDQILEHDPANIYAKRYQSLLEKKVKTSVE